MPLWRRCSTTMSICRPASVGFASPPNSTNSAVWTTWSERLTGATFQSWPLKHNKRDYVNRKSGNSIIISAVADAWCRFINLSVGYPGSMHDLTILRSSPLWRLAEVERHPYFQKNRLLGDSGYRSAPNWLVLPYRGDDLTEE